MISRVACRLGLLTDASWVYRQYDHQLFLNTVVGPGDDATVLRLKHPTTGEDTGGQFSLRTMGSGAEMYIITSSALQ